MELQEMKEESVFYPSHSHSCQNSGRPCHEEVIKKHGNVLTYEKYKLWLCVPQDSPLIIFTLTWYALTQTYFYVFLDNYQGTFKIFNLLGNFFFLYCYISGIMTEPGIIPKNQVTIQSPEEIPKLLDTDSEQSSLNVSAQTCQVEMEGSKKNPKLFFQERFCVTCKLIRPPKASHCSTCQNCTKLYDHHCNFFGNCIGQRNLKYFYLWLLSILYQGVVCYYCVFPQAYNNFDQDKLIKQYAQSLIIQLLFYVSLFCCCWASLQINFKQSIPLSCVRLYLKGEAFCLFAIVFLTFLYQFYDTNKKYTENFLCSFIFILSTCPIVIAATPVAIKYTLNIVNGQTEKEKIIRQRLHDNICIKNPFIWIFNFYKLMVYKAEPSQAF